MSTPLAEHLGAPDPATLDRVLAPDVRFHSPVADYAGDEQVRRLLTLVPGALDEVRIGRTLRGDDEAVTFLAGRVGDHAIDGVLDERYDADGRVAEITLMIRPLAGLREAVERMAAALR
ncbi:MAG TPA: nuclear transport factor 2 family protein [Capillimicrobium sp.]|nr:nuclear transport factor 2 family protein [Capillimicrobium sp.]